MNNKKKSEQLGMSYGKANSILRKRILFDLVKKLGLDICYRCGKKIERVEKLSIEHKIPWLDSITPIALFFDTNNIAFSHLSCNSRASRKGKKLSEEHKRKLSISHTGKKMSPEKYEKMVERNRKICTTQEFRNKVSNAMKKWHKNKS